jgi:predicted phage tail protein
MNTPTTRRPPERPVPPEVVTPLPQLLLARLDDAPEAAQHGAAVERYTEAQAAVARAARRVEEAERADAQSERDAVQQAKALPRAKAPKAREAVADAQRRRDAAAALLHEATRDLLDAARPFARETADRAEATTESELDGATAAIAEALRAIGRAQQASAAAGWLAVFAEGTAAPWQSGVHDPFARGTQGDLQAALSNLQAERERRRAWRDQLERERAAEEDQVTYTEEPGRPEREEQR